MGRTEIDLLRLARSRTISRAIIGSAQKRAALDDAAWRLAGGQCQLLQFGSARISRRLARVTRPIPIARPLPDIADHVVEAVAVRLEAADRRGPGLAVLVRVVAREDALPAVGDRLALGIEGTRPVVLAVATAARGEFPLRLGREFTAAPARIGERILVGDMHDGMIVLARNGAAGTGWLTPIGARHVLEALRDAAAAGDIGGLDEDHRAGNEQLLGHAGMRCRVETALGQSHVSRRRDEFAKLRVGHLVAIDPEAIDAHGVGEALLRPMALGAHDERSAMDEHHPRVVVVLRRQAGIAGAASEFGTHRTLLRRGECAIDPTGRADAHGTDQPVAHCHGTSPIHATPIRIPGTRTVSEPPTFAVAMSASTSLLRASGWQPSIAWWSDRTPQPGS